MAGYHNLTLVGNVGANPTVTDTEWGPVTNFDIAVNGRHNPPIWYSVAAWGKLGEAMAQYLSKGREVLIESDHFEPVWWTDRRSGDIVTRINVRASRVVFLDGGAPDNGNHQQQRTSQQYNQGLVRPTAPQQPRQQYNGNQRHQQQPQPQQWDNLTNEEIAQQVPF